MPSLARFRSSGRPATWLTAVAGVSVIAITSLTALRVGRAAGDAPPAGTQAAPSCACTTAAADRMPANDVPTVAVSDLPSASVPAPVRPPAAQKLAPRPSCDPPYSIDDHGRTIFKEECFPKK
jgi:hypothetical protein